MGRLKGFAAILGVAAVMVGVAACGNGAEPTPLSDEVPTQAPPTVGGTAPTDSNPPNYAHCVPRWPGQGLCKLGGQSESGGSDC